MIKKLKFFICKIFNIKICKCEVDEHLVMYEEVEETAKQKKIRLKHEGDIK
tara:strand:- start:149 stop:301 length:153 start_codon:yes stop_codon:yes gene_type:complete